MAADNMTLGRFRLEGIPTAPRGIPQIEVTFDIDANGILNVTAQDKATGREQKVTITASTNLQKADIERMVEESKVHKAEDERRKELAEARNIADNAAYQVEKAINEAGDKVSASDRSAIEARAQELRNAMTGEDVARIKSLTETLQQDYARVMQASAQAQSTPGGGEAGSNTSSDDSGDVIDGEFTEQS